MKKIHFYHLENTCLAGDCHSLHDIDSILCRGNLSKYSFDIILNGKIKIPINAGGSNQEIISELKSQWNMWNEHRGKAYRSKLNASMGSKRQPAKGVVLRSNNSEQIN